MSTSLKSVASILLVTCLISVCLAKVNIIDIPRKTVFNVAVLRNQKPVVVYFTTKTCYDCIPILKHLEGIARKNDEDMYLARVYVDQNPELKAQLGITSLPTTRTYFKGAVQREIKGTDRYAITSAVNSVLKKSEQAKKKY